jgi:hypothetical protein
MAQLPASAAARAARTLVIIMVPVSRTLRRRGAAFHFENAGDALTFPPPRVTAPRRT